MNSDPRKNLQYISIKLERVKEITHPDHGPYLAPRDRTCTINNS